MPQPTPIISACEFGRKDDVQRLIENGVNINALGFNEDLHDRTPLMAALEFQEVEIAVLILAAGADVNVVNSCGWTALHFAARGDDNVIGGEGHLEALRCILSTTQLNVNALTNASVGETALDIIIDNVQGEQKDQLIELIHHSGGRRAIEGVF